MPRRTLASACLAVAATLTLLCSRSLPAAPREQSPIVSLGNDGRLTYNADERGNRVPDFSHCGYAGGDRVIPEVPVRVVVEYSFTARF